MALTHIATSAPVFGAAVTNPSCTPTLPSGTLSGHRVYIVCCSKPSATAISGTTGWTVLSESTLGGVRLTVLARTYDGVWTMPTLQTTGTTTSGSIGAAATTMSPDSGFEIVSELVTTGADASSGTEFSATGAANISLASGDMVLAMAGTTNNATSSARNITATGATIGSVTEQADAGSANGADCSVKITTGSVTAGTSTAAPVHTMTLSGAGTGGVVFIRVRQTLAQTDFYVAAGGSDSNPGTIGSPWLTVNPMYSRTWKPGDTLHLNGGETFNGLVYFNTSGAVGNPITVTSYGTGKATIANTSNSGVFIDNASYFEVLNLIVDGGVGATAFDGISVYAAGAQETYVRITDCEVSGWKNGIVIGGDTGGGFADVVIENCDTFGNVNQGILTYGPQAPSYANSNVTVRNCRAWDNEGDAANTTTNSGSGITMGSVNTGLIELSEAWSNGSLCTAPEGPVGIWTHDSDSVVIQKCLSYNNETGSTADGDGFDLDVRTTNCTIRYCFAYGNEGAGILVYGGASTAHSGNKVHHNITWGNSRNHDFYYGELTFAGNVGNTQAFHNTCIAQDNGAIHPPPLSIESGASGATIRNNIFRADSGLLIRAAAAFTTGEVLLQGNAYEGGTGISWGGGDVGYRSASNTGDLAFVSSRAPAVPAGASVDDVMVAFLDRWQPGANPAVTAPAGFTKLTTQLVTSDSGAKTDVFWKRLTGSDAGTYSFSWSGSMWSSVHVVCLTGVKTSGDPIGAHIDTWIGNAGTYGQTDVNTTFKPGLVWHGYNDTAGTHTPPTGFTEVADVDSATTAYRIPGTTGVNAATGATASSSSISSAYLVALEPGGAVYASVAAFRAGQAGQEQVSGSDVGYEGTIGLVAPDTTPTITDVANLTALNDYKLGGGSAVKTAGLDLPTLFSMTIGTVDFYGETLGAPYSIGAHEAPSVVEHQGAATLTSVAGLTVGAIEELLPTVGLNASLALTAQGTEIAQALASLNVTADLDADVTKVAFAAVALLASSANLDVTGDVISAANANLATTVTLETSPTGVRLATVDLNAVADLILGEITAGRHAAAALTAIGALQVAAYGDRMAAVVLTTVASLDAGSGVSEGQGTVSLSAIPHLDLTVDREALSEVLMLAAAEIQAGAFSDHFATALLDVTATLQVEALGASGASVMLAAISTLQSDGIEGLFASAILSAVSELTSGTFKDSIVSQVDLDTSVSLASSLSGDVLAGVTLAALATLLADGVTENLGAVDLVAVPDLASDGLVLTDTSVLLSAQSDLSVSGLADRIASAVLSTSGALSANGGLTEEASVVLTAVSELLASGETGTVASVAFSTVAEFIAESLGDMQAAANLSTDAILLVDSSLERLAAVNLLAQVELSSDGVRSTLGLAELVAISELIAEVAIAVLQLPLSVQGPILQKLFRVRLSPQGLKERSTSGYKAQRETHPPF